MSEDTHVADLYRSFSDPKSEGAASVVNNGALSAWAGVLFLTLILVFGFHQMRDWVGGVHDRLDRVSEDNQRLLDGMEALLARSGPLDQVAQSEASPLAASPRKTAKTNTPGENDLSKRYKIYYRTKDGENLARICEKFGVPEDRLRNWNAMEPADSLIPGQVLVINKRGSQAEPVRAKMTTQATEMDEAAVDGSFGEFPDEPEEAIVHTVQAGETLSEIGLAYGVPWETLAANNRITDPETLYEGERLSISLDPVQTSTDDLEEMIHTVRTGENLYRIGLKYGVNWEYIARKNKILDGSVLFDGQVLKIPVARGGPEY